MTPKVILSVVASCAILSCTTNPDSGKSNADASGVYVREYAFEVSNPETGKKIGMRHVRDSIFVERTEEGYQVSNRKWRMNDYDQEGWVSMAHADNRPFPSFRATYDQQMQQLIPEVSSSFSSIFVDQSKQALFKDPSKQQPYRKVK